MKGTRGKYATVLTFVFGTLFTHKVIVMVERPARVLPHGEVGEACIVKTLLDVAVALSEVGSEVAVAMVNGAMFVRAIV